MIRGSGKYILFRCCVFAVILGVWSCDAFAQSVGKKDNQGPEEIYQEAVQLYRSGNYSESLLKFFKLDDVQPDYKEAETYIRKIEDYLSYKEQQKLSESSLLRQQGVKEDRLRQIEQRLVAEQNKVSAPASAKEVSLDDASIPVPQEEDISQAHKSDETDADSVVWETSDSSSPSEISDLPFSAEDSEATDGEVLSSLPGQEDNKKPDGDVSVKKQRQQAQLEAKVNQKRQRLAQREKAREQKELVREIRRLYREASASCKAGLFSISREETASLSEMLDRENLPRDFRAEMKRRVARLNDLLAGQVEDRRAKDRYLRMKEESEANVSSAKKIPEGTSLVAAGVPSEQSALPPGVTEDNRQPSSEKVAVAPKIVAPEKIVTREEKIAMREKAREMRLMKKEEKAQKAQTARMRRQMEKEQAKALTQYRESGLNKFERKMVNWQAEDSRAEKFKKSAELKRHKAKLEDEKKQRQKELQMGVEELYGDAIVYYAQGAYVKAEKLMREVDNIWPDYKLCRSYLELIRRQKENNGQASNPSLPSERESPPQKNKIIEESLNRVEKGSLEK